MMAANFYYNQIENLMFEVLISSENLLIFMFSLQQDPLDSFFFVLGSCLCGVALMSFVPRLMKSTGTQGKMLQNIT